MLIISYEFLLVLCVFPSGEIECSWATAQPTEMGAKPCIKYAKSSIYEFSTSSLSRIQFRCASFLQNQMKKASFAQTQIDANIPAHEACVDARGWSIEFRFDGQKWKSSTHRTTSAAKLNIAHGKGCCRHNTKYAFDTKWTFMLSLNILHWILVSDFYVMSRIQWKYAEKLNRYDRYRFIREWWEIHLRWVQRIIMRAHARMSILFCT